VVLGTEHLPPLGSEEYKRPMLFVGNHQRVGFYDTPLLVYEMAVRGYRWVAQDSRDHFLLSCLPFLPCLAPCACACLELVPGR